MEKSKTQRPKRRRLNGQHRWTDAETQSFVQVVADEIKDSPESFEKPTAQQFYEKIAAKAGLENVEWVPMKNKMRHLKSSFVAAVNYKNQAGAGDERTVVEDYINKICPKYKHLEQIFGQRKCLNPRVILETSDGVFDAEFSDGTLDFGNFRSSTPEPSSTPERCSETNSVGFSALKATLGSKANIKTTNSDPISFLISLQEKRLEIELRKFELERERAKAEIELKTKKQDHEFQIKKLQIESDERIRMYELELKSKRNEHPQMKPN